jgi:hypothetical protein
VVEVDMGGVVEVDMGVVVEVEVDTEVEVWEVLVGAGEWVV